MPRESIRHLPVAKLDARPWQWRADMNPGTFWLYHHGEMVGSFSVMPGHVNHRAVLMDALVDLLNNDEQQETPS